MSMYHFSDTEAVEHDVNTVPDSGDFERVEIDGQWYVPERTCRVESSHEEYGDGCYSYFEYELNCGHGIAWDDQLPPSYCPECGRRVLYDSNDYI